MVSASCYKDADKNYWWGNDLWDVLQQRNTAVENFTFNGDSQMTEFVSTWI